MKRAAEIILLSCFLVFGPAAGEGFPASEVFLYDGVETQDVDLFHPRNDLVSGGYMPEVANGDLNGDGFRDLVVVDVGAGDDYSLFEVRVRVLLGRGDGSPRGVGAGPAGDRRDEPGRLVPGDRPGPASRRPGSGNDSLLDPRR